MTRRSVGLVALAVLLTAIGAAHAMTLSVADANIVELIQQSNDIVAGRVRSVTDGIDERGIPYTEVTLQISEAIRGERSGEYKFRQFGLLSPRVTADGRRMQMPAPTGFPKYKAGEDLVLFLRPSAAWTGFRMPAGVTQGKFTVAAGRLENDLGNACLFRDVVLDQGLAIDSDKRLLTTGGGPVNPDAFLSFVRRAVGGRWIENGRMTRAGKRVELEAPPAERNDARDDTPAVRTSAPVPTTAPCDPLTDITLPRSGR